MVPSMSVCLLGPGCLRVLCQYGIKATHKSTECRLDWNCRRLELGSVWGPHCAYFVSVPTILCTHASFLSCGNLLFRCLYSSVAERQSCKLKVLGSIPSGGFFVSMLSWRRTWKLFTVSVPSCGKKCCSSDGKYVVSPLCWGIRAQSFGNVGRMLTDDCTCTGSLLQ